MQEDLLESAKPVFMVLCSHRGHPCSLPAFTHVMKKESPKVKELLPTSTKLFLHMVRANWVMHLKAADSKPHLMSQTMSLSSGRSGMASQNLLLLRLT